MHDEYEPIESVAALSACLPDDAMRAHLVGRVWWSGAPQGPRVVALREGALYDLTASVWTMSEWLDRDDRLWLASRAPAPCLGDLRDFLHLEAERTTSQPHLLAPCDLQAIKACGVTFVRSMTERVVEEQARGDAAAASALRSEVEARIGTELRRLVPGSPQAQQLKAELQSRGAWSPYLEVGLGPDAEIFTKAQPMSAVGHGARVGVLSDSRWNNPEPEVVLAVDSRGNTVGACLGNDVNLRDYEGRSALLLGRAKDNNASCAIGPFIRLFDDDFTLDTVRAARLRLLIRGRDGFELEESCGMSDISRDPLDLVAQACGVHHRYPDGMMLFLGTSFAPTADRSSKGSGFTHFPGDVVSIRSSALGSLVNAVHPVEATPEWRIGVRALMQMLSVIGRSPDAPAQHR